jgi:hypothetical protein
MNTFADDPGRLRISDADRAEVADLLSRHYGEGRLSQAEFDERLDQAMNARTRSDLNDLLADLPGGKAPAASGAAERIRPARRRHRILAPLLIIALIITAGHVLTWPFHLLPWLLIGLLAFIWLRRDPRRRRI